MAYQGGSIRTKSELRTTKPFGMFLPTGRTAHKPASPRLIKPKPLFCFCTHFLLQSTGIYSGNPNIFRCYAIPSGSDRKTNFAYKIFSIWGRDPEKSTWAHGCQISSPAQILQNPPYGMFLRSPLSPPATWFGPGDLLVAMGWSAIWPIFRLFWLFFKVELKKILFMEGGS